MSFGQYCVQASRLKSAATVLCGFVTPGHQLAWQFCLNNKISRRLEAGKSRRRGGDIISAEIRELGHACILKISLLDYLDGARARRKLHHSMDQSSESGLRCTRALVMLARLQS
jgi:hypothetical protein